VILVLGAALLGYWGFTALLHDGTQPGSPAALLTPTPTLTPSPSSTPIPTPTSTHAIPTPTPAANPGNTFPNSLGIEFVLIPAGAFAMGSPSEERDRYVEEGPIHHVTIKNAYYLGRYEVTQEQWRAVMGDNPSNFKGDDLPV